MDVSRLIFKTDGSSQVQLRLQYPNRMHRAFSKKQRWKLEFEACIAEQKAIVQIIKWIRGGTRIDKTKSPTKLIVFGEGLKMNDMHCVVD